MIAFLVVALAGALLAIYRESRENHRLRARLREGPLAYEACHAPSGADVVICPACAYAITWATGRRPPPVYSDGVDNDWGGIEGLTCNRCEQQIAPLAGGST